MTMIVNNDHLVFQSTLPVRGATYDCEKAHFGLKISIHAPRAGSDNHR